MHERVLLSGKKQAYQLLWLDLLALAIVSVIVLIFFGITVFYSFFVGGISCFVPAVYQVKKVFKESYASAAGRIVIRLYTTELLKFISLAVAFIVVMHWKHLNILAFILGFLIVNFGIWMVLPILMPSLMQVKR